MKTNTIDKPFLLEAPKATQAQKDLAAKLRKEVQDCYRAKEESFQRSDTDGFLSQWASGMSARVADRKAEILDNGGYAPTPGLFEGDRIVKAKIIDSKFGQCWLLAEEEQAKFGTVFVPVAYGKVSRKQKKFGLHEKTIYQPAWVKVDGKGTGLSGCASAYVATFVIDEPVTGE